MTSTEFPRGRPVLEVDLDALADNWRRLRDEAPGAEVAGVVKADAYGLGVAKVAPALVAAGCRRFFTATLDEAVAFRDVLPDAPVFVFEGLTAGEEGLYVEKRLSPVLNRPDEVERWVGRSQEAGRPLPAALQVETGIRRLGMDISDLEQMAPRLLDGFLLRVIMSHLACADTADHPLNEAQRARFRKILEILPAAPASLANSSGVFLGPAFHFNLCRPGIALYGGNPTPGRPNPMRPVVTLTAPVLQVHDIAEAGSVGYGATFATRPGQRIATIGVGYADGYLRAAGNRATARIGAETVPLAGRVSMDLITLDVSALPPDAVQPGTPVELIGGPDGVDQLAESCGTIAYEVLTRLGGRFARVYVGGRRDENA